jgi:hypothetical protein
MNESRSQSKVSLYPWKVCGSIPPPFNGTLFESLPAWITVSPSKSLAVVRVHSKSEPYDA